MKRIGSSAIENGFPCFSRFKPTTDLPTPSHAQLRQHCARPASPRCFPQRGWGAWHDQWHMVMEWWPWEICGYMGMHQQAPACHIFIYTQYVYMTLLIFIYLQSLFIWVDVYASVCTFVHLHCVMVEGWTIGSSASNLLSPTVSTVACLQSRKDSCSTGFPLLHCLPYVQLVLPVLSVPALDTTAAVVIHRPILTHFVFHGGLRHPSQWS